MSSELATTAQKCEQLEVEITRINEELKLVKDGKDIIVQSLSKQVEQLGRQTKDVSLAAFFSIFSYIYLNYISNNYLNKCINSCQRKG